MSPVVVRVPSGATAHLEGDDMTKLINALWAVSATTGAVALVGKLGHALGSRSDVAVADDETEALRAALDAADALPVQLAQLRSALL